MRSSAEGQLFRAASALCVLALYILNATYTRHSSACLSACLPACLPVCLPACLPACLPVCLSISRAGVT